MGEPQYYCHGSFKTCNYHFLPNKGPGTSGDPCSENYRGTRPFSEPETAAISQKIMQLNDRIVLYMTLHSYGQYWLTPWGFTYKVPEDYKDMVSITENKKRTKTEIRNC